MISNYTAYLPIRLKKWLTGERFFMLGIMGVNGLNYLFNLLMGRILGPSEFADVALIITLLLIFSFLATSFQVVTTKFQIILNPEEENSVIKYLIRKALIVGIGIMLLIFIFSEWLQQLFNTESPWLFRVFALGIPIYFVLSINRGVFQGKLAFYKLTYSYVFEAVVKLVLSIILIYLGSLQSSIAVSIAVFASLLIAMFPTNFDFSYFKKSFISGSLKRKTALFFAGVLLYELIQVLINSSDIFLVKMYFSDLEAGLYSSLALIGRVIYFLTWMLVMLVLPKVIEAEKNGQNASDILKPFFIAVLVFCASLVLICFFFSEEIVFLMFGNEFIKIHSLLYLYAVATSLFALSNILIYYFLALENYHLIYCALVLAVAQILGIVFFHQNLFTVILIQIISMLLLFITSLIYFKFRNKLK